MIYEHSVTIPPNTEQEEPIDSSFIVHPGTVTLVSIEFPPGHCGLTHCVILWSEQQLWPSHPDQSFTGDAVVHNFPENLVLSKEPFESTVRAWNLDYLLEHTIKVRMSIIGKGLTTAEKIVKSLASTTKFVTKG